MDWIDKVFPITTQGAAPKFLGTGFVCGADGDRVHVITCWHVVRDPRAEGQAQAVAIRGQPCVLVSEPGDDVLDLAVLEVSGIGHSGAFRPAGGAAEGIDFDNVGYAQQGKKVIARPITGTLSKQTVSEDAQYRPVISWDCYLKDDAGELDKLRDGYSGSPVYAPDSATVVAVITDRTGDDKGSAIDLSNLARVYPRSGAQALILVSSAPAQPAADAEPDADSGEYEATRGELLAKTLDHADQLDTLSELNLFAGAAGADRLVAMVEACSDDCPEYLADHVHMHPWSEFNGSPPEAIVLELTRHDTSAFWEALLGPAAARGMDDADAQRDAVHGWLDSGGLRVLLAQVELERHGRRLPEMMRGARADLERLGALAPGTRVLVLFIALTEGGRLPFWWRPYASIFLSRKADLNLLGALRPLQTTDVEKWYSSFPRALRRNHDRGQLKDALLDLIKAQRTIRFRDAQRCLNDALAEPRSR